jgi:hypothetical protein
VIKLLFDELFRDSYLIFIDILVNLVFLVLLAFRV